MDLSRFHATFLAESREGLDAMEAGLLDIEGGRADGETIHTVFRAAHSIKGGAATFGFQDMASVTHVLETLLEEIRSNKRVADGETLSALLASVDVLRGLLDVAERGGETDRPAVDAITRRLEAVLTGQAAAATAPAAGTAAAASPAPTGTGWRVGFKPLPSIYMSGNDPLRILRELERLGPMTVDCDLSRLPDFDALDPHTCHFQWTLSLPEQTNRAPIDDAFAWVEDECELDIKPLADTGAERPVQVQVQVQTEPAPPAPAPAAGSTPVAAAPANAPETGAALGGAVDSTLRVQTSKIDALINLVGELVITQAMLKQSGTQFEGPQFERLLSGLELLERNTRDLQEAVISIRMMPMGSVFSRFPRLVRDLSARLGKQVRLRTIGEATELDKGMIEKISDPLVHLVRNAIDHGLETPDERQAGGKDAQGTITLEASHQGGRIVITVADDGRGLNREKILRKAAERGLALPENPSDSQVWDLIFHPGFSTADQVTDLSGRGVGMDVVRKNILALGGEVGIESAAGRGTTITVRLPLTLAILDGMTVAVGEETFVLPLGYVIEAMQPGSSEIRSVHGAGRVLKVRGEYLPLVHLAEFYNLGRASESGEVLVVVVEADGRKLALVVDELLGQQQVVVKNLEANYRRIPAVSGATILGDGRVALIVDVGGLGRAMTAAA